MTDNNEEILPLVDETGTVIGRATRGTCHNGEKLLHPVVHLHVFDLQGNLYLQKRPCWKDIQPGRWDTAVGVNVGWNETIGQALRREAREEINLTDFEPELLTRYVFESARERELVNVFRCVTTLQPSISEEVEDARFFSREEIRNRLDTDFFTPNFEQEWRRFFSQAEETA